MDIKEIADRVSKRIYVEDGLLLSKFISEKFAEALIAELAKQNEPDAWAIYVTGDLCDVFQNKDFALLEFNRRNQLYPEPSREFRGLYTIPPTAEQIAKETAEACAKACEDVIGNTPHDQRMLAAIDCAVMLRSGAWKGFKK